MERFEGYFAYLADELPQHDPEEVEEVATVILRYLHSEADRHIVPSNPDDRTRFMELIDERTPDVERRVVVDVIGVIEQHGTEEVID